MDHQGQPVLYRPAYLLFEGDQLLAFEIPTPIKIQPNFTYGDERMWPQEVSFHSGEHLLEVCFHLFGMQSEHGIGIRRVTAGNLLCGNGRFFVDGRDKDPRHTGGLCPRNHLREIFAIVVGIKMNMRIDDVHGW